MVIVPAGHGWLWLKRGFAIFRRSPLLWALAVFSYWILMAVLGLVPYAGTVAATVLIPVFSVSFMVIAREVERGGRLELPLLFSGFRHNLPALLMLGGLYLTGTIAVLLSSQIADGGALMRWMLIGERPNAAALEDGSVGRAGLLALALYTPLLAAFWFAPVLIAWQRMPPFKALFYSFFATLRNWRPFFVYGAAVTLVAGLLPMLAAALVAILFGDVAAVTRIAPVVLFVYVAGLVPTLFASFYATYADIFPDTGPEQGYAGAA